MWWELNTGQNAVKHFCWVAKYGSFYLWEKVWVAVETGNWKSVHVLHTHQFSTRSAEHHYRFTDTKLYLVICVNNLSRSSYESWMAKSQTSYQKFCVTFSVSWDPSLPLALHELPSNLQALTRPASRTSLKYCNDCHLMCTITSWSGIRLRVLSQWISRAPMITLQK